MMGLFGVDELSGVWSGTPASTQRIDYIKQDLAFSPVIDLVQTSDDGTVPVHGRKLIWVLDPSNTVHATFHSDGAPAMVSRSVGKGKTFAFGFDVGLSYFKPAIPLRPVARGSNDACFNHFLPTTFSTSAKTMATLPTAETIGASPVHSSESLVDVGIISAAHGTVLTVVNWSPDSLPALNLTLQFSTTFETAALASGGTLVTARAASGFWSFAFTLDVADAIILRL
jgi:hypothetical protein